MGVLERGRTGKRACGGCAPRNSNENFMSVRPYAPRQLALLGRLQLATAGSSRSTRYIIWFHLRCSGGHDLEVVCGRDRGQRGRKRCSLCVHEWGRRGVGRTRGRASERVRIGMRVRLMSVQPYATPACMIRPATAGYGRQQSLHPTTLHPSHTYIDV